MSTDKLSGMEALREKLAEAIYNTKPWTSLPGLPEEHVMNWQEAKDYDMGGYADEIHGEADAAILALREWLEAEAREARKTREEVKAEPGASDYRKGYFAGAEFAIDCLIGKIAAAPDALKPHEPHQ
jgi:hypothetical protein